MCHSQAQLCMESVGGTRSGGVWLEVHVHTFSKLSTVRAPVFGRHQFFSTSEHYGKANGSLLS